jgi:isopentenyl diphosphate isomerase/L-lactate dehydrogenase-like FMN-dependent dehydrogenase
MNVKRALNIADLRTLAQRRLPRVVFDYIDGGADDEITMRANCSVFDTVEFKPRCVRAHRACSLRTSVLGTAIDVPFILGPVGSTRMFYPRGECVAAAQAANAGTIYTLSTLSGTRLEEVRAASTGPLWYQLYTIGGREMSVAAIERARAAGYSALVVTIDTAVAGMRERDFRGGARELLSRNPFRMLPYMPQFLARPRWAAACLRDGGLIKFPNVVFPEGPMEYADVASALAQATLCWDDLHWIRQAWRGPIIIKGVQTVEDAREAVDAGADAIVVSNHGGRQLDGVPASLRVLPGVVEAVGDRTEVLFDSGIRRGSDIVKALCLGAKAVMIGRAYAYGLAAGGGPGVARAIEILRSGVTRTMRLLGCPDIESLDASCIDASRL